MRFGAKDLTTSNKKNGEHTPLCNSFHKFLLNVDGRTTIGYIEARTQGDVHLLSSFRPTGSVVSVDTEILTSKSDWKISILNGDELVKDHIRLEDCKCDCIDRV